MLNPSRKPLKGGAGEGRAVAQALHHRGGREGGDLFGAAEGPVKGLKHINRVMEHIE